MKLQLKEVDASIERNLIIGMIVNDSFLRKIDSIIRIDLLQTPFVKTVALWCLDYFNEFQSHPGPLIQNIFESKKDQLDTDLSDLIDSFLSSISEEYDREQFNVDFILKEAENYFKKQSLLELSGDLRVLLSQGKVEEAETRRLAHEQIISPSSNSVDIFDENNIHESFQKDQGEILFKLPKELGKLVLPFRRTNLVAVTASMKKGKSFILIDWAVRAMRSGCKVFFLSLEMPNNEVSLRFYQNMLGEIHLSDRQLMSEEALEQDIEIPYFTEDGEVEYHVERKKGLGKARTLKKMEAIKKAAKGGCIRLENLPAFSVNTDTIKNKLILEKHQHDFVPDVIIVDYADIMMPEKNSPKETRNQINQTWMALRRLAQETNTCVITATQGSRASFKKDIEEDDTSEDIRKLAHVSRMIGLNSGGKNKKDYNYELEKKFSLRLNVIVERHGYFDPEKMVRVLKCFEIGKAYLDSKTID